jgi:hypothetical protein
MWLAPTKINYVYSQLTVPMFELENNSYVFRLPSIPILREQQYSYTYSVVTWIFDYKWENIKSLVISIHYNVVAMFSIILKLYRNYCNIGRLIDVQNASSKSLERVEILRVLMKWKILYINTPCVHHGWSHCVGSESSRNM